MLSQVREILCGVKPIPDTRLDSLKMVRIQDILNCLHIISGFGVNVCSENKIGTIKTLRRLSEETLNLKHAKDIVEVLCEACQEDHNACDVLFRELSDVS